MEWIVGALVLLGIVAVVFWFYAYAHGQSAHRASPASSENSDAPAFYDQETVLGGESEGGALDATTVASPPSSSSQRLGPYTILQQIGRGGMGAVLKGVGENGEVVAIKVIRHKQGTHPELIGRFLRENQIASSLDHSRIAKTYPFGEENGEYFFAMEFIDGRSVKELIVGDQVDLPLAMRVVAQSCEGLAYAHAHNVIHRDIKPDNIMVTQAGDVKIVDFGIARMEGDDQPELTMDGAVMGTPSYMSPEQKENSKTVDHRADIYSLGVTLYQMISGKLPTGLLSLELIPAGVRSIIERSIAYDRESRYPDCNAMLADTREYLETGKISVDENALLSVEENAKLRDLMIDSLYPKETPQYEGVDVSALYMPAGGIGGNYYDFIEIDETHLGILVGNVFEKPSPESVIFLTALRSAFRIFAANETNPGEALRKTNDHISRERFDEFAMFSYIILDTKERTACFASAGYRPGSILRAGADTFENIEGEGTGLGILEGSEYSATCLQVGSGDLIALSSSGVVETRSLAGEIFGQERLDALLREHRDDSANSITAAVRKNIMRFSAGVAQNDDMTVVVIRT